MERQTAYLLEAGVNGIFVNGTTAEALYTSPLEKLVAARIVAKTAENSGVNVYVGVTGRSEEETYTNLHNLSSFGVDGYTIAAIVLAPLVYRSNEGIVGHVEEILQMTDFPLILYTYSKIALNQENFDVGAFEELAKRKKIIGLKDSSGQMKRLGKYVDVAGNCAVLQGDQTKYLSAFKRGAKGIVPSLANTFPKLFVALHKALMDGRYDDARAYQEQVIAIGSRMSSCYSKTVGSLKVAQAIKGVISFQALHPDNNSEELVTLRERGGIRKIISETEEFCRAI